MNEDTKNDFQKKVGVGEKQYLYGRHVGKKKKTKVLNDDNGKVGGYQTEHWSGRVDATVTPPTKRIKLGLT